MSIIIEPTEIEIETIAPMPKPKSKNGKIGWYCHEAVGIGIVNPSAIVILGPRFKQD